MAIRSGRAERRNAYDRWRGPADQPGKVVGQPLSDSLPRKPREADGKHDASKSVRQTWQPHDRPRKQEQR
jgi:hypothetical protein